MTQNDTQIINASPVAYFTMIPNLVLEMDLSPFAFRLYCQFVRRAGWDSDGACWENTRNLAKACSMSLGAVSKSKKELAAAGLVFIERVQKEHGEFPYDRITLVDVWQKNLDHFTCSPHEQDLFTTRTGPVHDTRLKNNQINNSQDEIISNKGALNAPLHSPRKKRAARGVQATSPLDVAKREKLSELRKHPAIEAIKKVSGYYPRGEATCKQLIKWIGDTPDMPKLEWAFSEWVDGKAGNPMKTLVWVRDGYVGDFYYESENHLPKPVDNPGEMWGEV